MQLHLPDNIDISHKITDFKGYLNSSSRIILSARFGDGKSYFLKKFQEEQYIKEEYDLYTIYPVNYSVAKNEDIFEYIKRDIIYQLNEKGILDKFDLDAFVDSISSFVNLQMLAGFLAPLFPGGDLFLKVFNKLKGKYDEIKHDKDDYIHLFEEQKGGIYERDGFTALINNALDYIKNNKETPKKPVLVIEDLDRLDPKHLFRILNIISAHFDEQSPVGKQNKFEFENIILVLDYETTEHIFHHFYGQQANYDGYMKKFLIREPFRYSIRELFISDVKQQLARNLGIPNLFALMPNINKRMDEMSMRDLTKFCDFDVTTHIKRDVYQWNEFQIQTNLPLFRYYIYAIELGLSSNQIIEDLAIDLNEDITNEHFGLIMPLLFITQNKVTVFLKYKYGVYAGSGEMKNGVLGNLKHSQAYSWIGNPDLYSTDKMREIIELSFGYIGDVLNISALIRK